MLKLPCLPSLAMSGWLISSLQKDKAAAVGRPSWNLKALIVPFYELQVCQRGCHSWGLAHGAGDHPCG